MVRFWVAISISLVAAKAGAQDDARDILRKAVLAHGGEQTILKVRQALVSYEVDGVVPGMEQIGPINITVDETYSLPRIKKVIKGNGGGRPIDVRWAILGDGYWWYQENNEPVQVQRFKGSSETQYRPFLILEQLVACLGKEATVEVVEKTDREIGLSLLNEKTGLGGQVWFDSGTLLLARSQTVLPNGTEQESKFSDYREFDGLKAFTRQETFRGNNQVATMIIRRVELLDAIDDEVFEEPTQKPIVLQGNEPRGYSLAEFAIVSIAMVVMAIALFIAVQIRRRSMG